MALGRESAGTLGMSFGSAMGRLVRNLAEEGYPFAKYRNYDLLKFKNGD